MLYEVALFDSVLEADEYNELMEKGLVTLMPVEPAGKLTTTWGNLKSHNRLSKPGAAGSLT